MVSRTPTPDFNDDNHEATIEYTLEDGQLRLTSLIILANSIRKRLEILDGGASIDSQELERLIFFRKGELRRRIQNRNPSLDQYLSFVLTGAPAPPAERTPPMRALDAVQNQAQDFVADKSRNELLTWKAKIQNQAKFILVDLASENISRYLVFDAINSRGLALTEFDKIKNFRILIDKIRNLSLQPEVAC
ncbi:GmrSD restriction endonuclease domain-containing protein [Falsiroseomonas sp. CW058]|uniref:GmrSD restriction endonuclease domain-containing protein n=1 Tax=Falsiroseomonas sp. CW058 TaxID=3388664 RepID=UPI003D31AFEE